MACFCPNCSTPLSPLRIRRHMVCPKCNSKLSVSYMGAMVLAFVLWGLVDLFLLALMFSGFGDSLLVHAGRILISGFIGFALIGATVKGLATVRSES